MSNTKNIYSAEQKGGRVYVRRSRRKVEKSLFRNLLSGVVRVEQRVLVQAAERVHIPSLLFWTFLLISALTQVELECWVLAFTERPAPLGSLVPFFFCLLEKEGTLFYSVDRSLLRLACAEPGFKLFAAIFVSCWTSLSVWWELVCR